MDLGAMLKGRGVLITGASGGLGAHFAQVAARNGARVVIGARRKAKLDALAAELKTLGAQSVLAVDMDVGSDAAIRAAFDAVEAEGGPVDVVVNNAGVGGEGAAIDMSPADFDATLQTNLRGVWLTSTEAARRWRAAKRGGSIINIASILGERVAHMVVPYSTTKAAVIQMTKGLALEWARYGIRVNAIAPGHIRTDINDAFFETQAGQDMIKRIPMRRLGRAEELDGVYLLLATEASSWMTGALIAVDGGHLVSSL
ncbi:2-deoxy-D-gluconate 3-dehydrogenase [Variovorax sp. WS11]|uniref:SDR family NAD(P)-dependent oxidoreductase n=1 Tax=Variovorax sp. WS11 TaxID=1105204 RepID=UPI000D0D7466|nr:SDR family oxidoreductase [Variovorax sp. WS11]NDZ17381.1 SDR family oxidoreductase [Variovorax sp. WS11]PSL86082.1 2-deoxy-D-gluconate 3-dehydrogenase [Variovorax sp. WS11]